MKELFKKTATSIIISSIAAFIIGLIMVVAPGVSLQTMGIVAGIYIIIHGIVLMALAFSTHTIYTPFFGVMSGLLSIILGVVLVSMPSILPVIFTIALGIWIILSSINVISIAITVKKEYSNWCLLLLLGIIDLICGIIILFNSFASLISLVVLSGVIIMVHSIVNIVDMIIIRNNVKDIEKAVEANIKGLKKSNS